MPSRGGGRDRNKERQKGLICGNDLQERMGSCYTRTSPATLLTSGSCVVRCGSITHPAKPAAPFKTFAIFSGAHVDCLRREALELGRDGTAGVRHGRGTREEQDGECGDGHGVVHYGESRRLEYIVDLVLDWLSCLFLSACPVGDITASYNYRLKLHVTS